MHTTLRDPVCGMDVTYETAQARCKESFDREPEAYIQQEEDLPR